MEVSTPLIEDLLCAQVLTLAALMKAAKERQGTQSTSDFMTEATDLISRQRAEILRRLRQR
jgi:hypothetical protein